jgi:CRP-like cAMP-binding protein
MSSKIRLISEKAEGARAEKAKGAHTRNRLLQLMPDDEFAILKIKSEEVPLVPRQILHHWRLPMEYAYFVERGLVSVSARVDDSKFVEAWLIGSEGMIGAPLLLTHDKTPPHRRVVQMGGSALRIPARDFLALLDQLPTFHRILLRYIEVVLVQTSQSGACNAVHSLKQRLARWILVAANALQEESLSVSQSVLSQLLGVRRASVTECIAHLEREGSIRSVRRLITITDRQLLRKASCSCADLIDQEYRRQLSCKAIIAANALGIPSR